MNVHFLQHVPFEGPAMLLDWAESRGYHTKISKLYDVDPLPAPPDVDLLVILGGPMGVHDVEHFPWLAKEKEFLKECLRREVKTVGICLGAQLLASSLGARVYANDQKEIGWYPIEWSEQARQHPWFEFFPTQQKVLHWHGDTFDIPDNAVNLALSSACPRQGFLFGERALGLQFHLEMTKESLRPLIGQSRGELSAGGRYVQSAEQVLAEDQLFRTTNEMMAELMDRFVGADRQ